MPSMAGDPVTLGAVLAAGSAASATEAIRAAARGGAAALMIPLAASGDRAATLPFEMADFDAGASPPGVSLTRVDVDAIAAAAATQGVGLVVSIGDQAGLALVRGVRVAAVHLTAATLLDLPVIAAASG